MSASDAGLLFYAAATVLVCEVALVGQIARLRARIRKLEEGSGLQTRALRLSHQRAEMQEREIDRIEEHVGLSRVEAPKEGPYR